MAGRWVEGLILTLIVAGCGSSTGSPVLGGGGATAQAGEDGFAELGGAGGTQNAGTHSGGAKSGGIANGGTHSGGAANGGTPNGGTHNGGTQNGGTHNGGTQNGGTHSGGAGNGGSNQAGAHGGGKNTSGAGAGGSGGYPGCVSKDDASAPFNEFERTSQPAPAAKGGPIASGTYFLTNLTYHGGTPIPGATCYPLLVREVLRFVATSSTKGVMHTTTHFGYEDGSGDSVSPSEATYESQGSSLSCESTCSSPDKYAESYTATGNQFFFIRGPFDAPCDAGVTLVLTYERQP